MGHENRFVFSKADTSIIKIEHFSSMILRKPILRSFSRTQHALILYKLGEWSSENVSYSRSPLVLAKIFPRPLKAISHSSLFDLHIFKFSMRLIVASVFATVSNIPTLPPNTNVFGSNRRYRTGTCINRIADVTV